MAIRPGVVHKAACLAKTDLTTELVKEFTELQGIVGGLYARVQELDPTLPEATRLAIADAIYDQYKPSPPKIRVPRSIEGAVLSIADKADRLPACLRWAASDGIERSICAAAAGQRNRQDDRREETAVASGQI